LATRRRVIAVQTKAGSNKIHGDVFGFSGLYYWQTRPAVLARRNQPPLSNSTNFGGTLGGPVMRDHAFLFGAYEGVRLKNAYSYVDSTIPFGLINVTPNGDVDLLSGGPWGGGKPR